MAERIKCGVIGAGWWATYAHIPALRAHPAAELVAIQKRDPIEARKVADDFGVPFACTTAEELLAIPGLQAVVVSSSPNLHYEQAAAALERGMHVLIEKPMTLTAAESARLVELAEKRGVQFLISCPWHYTAHGREAQRLVRSGELGAVRMISALMTNPVAHLLRGAGTEPTHGTPYMEPREGTYSDPKIAGAGQIYCQVSHLAAYLTFVTGALPSNVFARFHNDGEALDLYDTLNLKMSDGSLASIASTGVTSDNRRDYEIRIFGTRGMLFLDLWRGKMEFVSIEGERLSYPDLAEDEIYPHQAPAINLIDSILDPSCNRSPATLGLAAMEAIEAACHSAVSGKDVEITRTTGEASCVQFS
jgi:predicted dehydrogenase